MLLSIAIIAIVGAFSYLPSLRNNFLEIDDTVLVTENPFVVKASPNKIGDLFLKPYMGLYHPLVTLSYMIEYRAFGMNPSAFHATNLALHIFISILVYLLFLKTAFPLRVSLFAALVFAAHPVHVESVAWISERKDLLSAFFYLISLLAYLNYLDRRDKKYLYASAFIFALSLLSKPMAVTLPAALILLDYLRERKDVSKILLEKLPFFALSALFTFIALRAQYSTEFYSGPLFAGGIASQALFAAFGLLFYAGKFVAPVGLSFVYPFKAGNISAAAGIVSLAALCLIAAVMLTKYRNNRRAVFGALFFVITLAPVLQLIPFGIGTHADRYLYLPSVGLLFILSAALSTIDSAGAKRLLTTAGVVCVLLLSAATWKTASLWHDSITLLNNAITKYPLSEIALCMRGDIYNRRGDNVSALRDYELALTANPKYAPAHNSMGGLFHSSGENEKAFQAYTEALRANPFFTKAYARRAALLSEQGNYKAALRDYSAFLELNPRSWQEWVTRGVLYGKLGDFRQATADFTKALEIKPYSTEALQNRAYAFFYAGEYQKSWDDVLTLRQISGSVNPEFQKALENKLKPR